MKAYVVAVRDRALVSYGRPFVVPSLGVCIRAFGDMVSGQDEQMSKHPEDYDLFHLGFFDEETGRLESVDVPVQIAIGKQMVVPKGGA